MTNEKEKDMAMAFASASAFAAQNRLQAAHAKAKKDTIKEKLFIALAESSEIHARRILMHLRGKIIETQQHLQEARDHSHDLYTKNYPAMAKDAQKGDKKSLPELFENLAQVAEEHYHLVKAILAEEIDVSTSFHICNVCGHIALEGIPERCPVCNAVPERFKPL